MTVISPAAAGLGGGQQISASVVNSFRVAAVAERLATHTQPGRQPKSSEFFSLCLSLARGIDYAIANNEVPAKAQELPLLLKQICQHRNDLFLQAPVMVLMISVKSACKMSWFSDRETQELLTLANEVGSCFCTPEGINNELDGSLSTVLEIMSRFYPSMKMGHILASLEAQPGYSTLVVDFQISKNITHSSREKIRLFVAQKDNIETSACIISPQQVNLLLNGKGVERRTNASMDMGPQLPTDVTAMLKYGTNLLQAVGKFCGHYIILIAFMSMESSPDASSCTLPDYVQSVDSAPGSEDSDLIEGPSRISLKCPISRTRIRTPVKGDACKHLQCFDFNNYVDINSRRPSWRCPHCNQHVCYTNIRIDQNMVKVLKEVAGDVSDVIISADGSWKAVMENDGDVDELPDKILDCQKDGSEQQESATGVPIVLDLTQADTEVDAMETMEIEDRKPPVANLQSLSAAPNLTATPELVNTAGTNQNIASNMEDSYWSALYSSLVSGTSTYRIDTQVGGRSESTPNVTVSPVFSDAISPAPNRADARGNAAPGVQNQVAAANLQLQPSQIVNSTSNHEHGNLHNIIPRHVNRTPTAVQALPAMSQTQTHTPTPQQISRNSMNTMSTNSSSRTPHQNRNQQERTFVPGQSIQQVGVAAPSQLPYRGLGDYQNPHLQQALNSRFSQPRSPSPGLVRSQSPRAAQVGMGYAVGNVNVNRFVPAPQRATQMARQPPMVTVQTQTPRAAAPYPGNVDGIRVSAVENRLNMGGLAPVTSRADTSAEQNWRPSGRMRGSLTGRAYSEALSQMMIQPTQSTQAARPPQTNLTSPPVVPPHLQAILANNRNPVGPQMQNNAMTQTAAMNSSSGTLPDGSSGMH
ncbi:PROTEIN INHIBITOR OF ACTIVATED STAT LIKE 2 [Hibiscus trionum]|uniref:PROTEIN INHIBITOR OF ACTIVATED STAT LIKE 2 n=1 Tax=Hibiscus trionum TaxID=183268 RepID=A0A9W7IER1_HIBTR|nr:PROTEIN INHIBITOR OF ACTIVATED STAT LIKE 2 [Hibiscus trionum]